MEPLGREGGGCWMKTNLKNKGCEGKKREERLLIKPNLRKRKNEKIIFNNDMFPNR